jgi:hypothetical protein
LGGAGGGIGQVLALGDVVVVELRVQPGGSGDLVEPVGRPSGRPVDEGDREAVAGDDVPGSGVAVTACGSTVSPGM